MDTDYYILVETEDIDFSILRQAVLESNTIVAGELLVSDSDGDYNIREGLG